jgi:hypothetical protein
LDETSRLLNSGGLPNDAMYVDISIISSRFIGYRDGGDETMWDGPRHQEMLRKIVQDTTDNLIDIASINAAQLDRYRPSIPVNDTHRESHYK